MVGIHLLLLHWNCPSSHSSVAGNKNKNKREGERQSPDGPSATTNGYSGVVAACSSTVICNWMPNWYSAFIQVNWLRRRERHAQCFSFTCFSSSPAWLKSVERKDEAPSLLDTVLINRERLSVGYYSSWCSRLWMLTDARHKTGARGLQREPLRNRETDWWIA